MRADARGRKLEGKGDSVQSATDLGDVRRVRIRQFKGMDAISDLFDKELHRGKAESLHCRERLHIPGRALEGWEMVHLLTLGSKRLPARGQNVHVWGVAEYILGQI